MLSNFTFYYMKKEPGRESVCEKAKIKSCFLCESVWNPAAQ